MTEPRMRTCQSCGGRNLGDAEGRCISCQQPLVRPPRAPRLESFVVARPLEIDGRLRDVGEVVQVDPTDEWIDSRIGVWLERPTLPPAPARRSPAGLYLVTGSGLTRGIHVIASGAVVFLNEGAADKLGPELVSPISLRELLAAEGEGERH